MFIGSKWGKARGGGLDGDAPDDITSFLDGNLPDSLDAAMYIPGMRGFPVFTKPVAWFG